MACPAGQLLCDKGSPDYHLVLVRQSLLVRTCIVTLHQIHCPKDLTGIIVCLSAI